MTHIDAQHIHASDPPKGPKWTKELQEQVRSVWGRKTASEIARDLNKSGYPFTRNAVIGIAHRLGLTKSDKTRQHAHLGRERRPPSGSTASKVIHAIERKKRRVGVRAQIAAASITNLPEDDSRALHISLFELTNDTCKWPFGDGPYTFCGCKSLLGLPYCAYHTRRSIGEGTPSELAAHRIDRRVA